MIEYQELDYFRVELDVVQIAHALLLRAEQSRPETSGQIRRGHLVVRAVRGHFVKVIHQHSQRFEVERRQRLQKAM